MEWHILLQNIRFRNGKELTSFDGRNHFENDYSRLIASSFIRRLQDKTQVFPLHQSDFIRTRLTHSLEVSAIARSIGKSVEKLLIENKLMGIENKELLPSLLTVAGLIHDLGNPPYGHFGESAINDFFLEYFKKNSDKINLNDQEKGDFTKFDGNVQTFRILRKLQFQGDEFSYNLTFPTLASIIKYPHNSLNGNITNPMNVSEKKFGYFITEEQDYKAISDTLGLNNQRHPVTYLLEAADDIAYSAADIEDGIKLGILDYHTIYEVFEEELINPSEMEKEILDKLAELNKEYSKSISDSLNLIITKFRIFTQGKMIESVITRFMEVHSVIINGSYTKEIIKDCASSRIRKAFKNLGKKVYSDSNVIQAEIAGYTVIHGLLDKFVNATYSKNFSDDGNGLDARLYSLISSSLRHIYRTYSNHNNDEYLRLQLIVDFISGMTDTYALNYYKRLEGISYK